MDEEEELVEFIIRDPLAWRIWMNGYELGLAHGHQDERYGMEAMADLIARRRIILERGQEHIVTERANTMTMAEVRRARNNTHIGSYKGGPGLWETKDNE